MQNARFIGRQALWTPIFVQNARFRREAPTIAKLYVFRRATTCATTENESSPSRGVEKSDRNVHMASVHIPGPETAKGGYANYLTVPFILTADEDYPEAINDYIRERARGALPHDPRKPRRLVLQPLNMGSALALARDIANFLSWGETEQAHPMLGTLRWQDIKAWHIDDLYRDALESGHWTEAFFITGVPRRLKGGVIKTRLSRVKAMYNHLSALGHLPIHFEQAPMAIVIRSKDDAMLAYRNEERARSLSVAPPAARATRRTPGDLPLPSAEHLIEFFHHMPEPHRFGAMLMFEAGMRAEEAIENTLLPGRLHRRQQDPRHWYCLPSWPKSPYLLNYKLSDDRMIGVLPPAEMAWFPEARGGYQCDMKILGKGLVLRRIHVAPRLLRRIWRYVGTEHYAERCRVGARRGLPPSGHLMLNRFGEKLSYHALWEAFTRANQILGATQDITPHMLRHAFACYYIEASILGQAKSMGFGASSIPPDLMLRLGNSVLLVLQQELGHVLATSTRRYLRQLVDGEIRLNALRMWNSRLDALHAENDSFLLEERDSVQRDEVHRRGLPPHEKGA